MQKQYLGKSPDSIIQDQIMNRSMIYKLPSTKIENREHHHFLVDVRL